jgi:hypothetical protein
MYNSPIWNKTCCNWINTGVNQTFRRLCHECTLKAQRCPTHFTIRRNQWISNFISISDTNLIYWKSATGCGKNSSGGNSRTFQSVETSKRHQFVGKCTFVTNAWKKQQLSSTLHWVPNARVAFYVFSAVHAHGFYCPSILWKTRMRDPHLKQ